ncbi:MAG: hypothetical protein ABII06_11255 [Pseudomonadota bacterium]
MDEETKINVKKMAEKAEKKVAESILRWKYKKEGQPLPDEEHLGLQSSLITERANEIISKRGKRIWEEIKKGCRGTKKEEDRED